MLIRGKPIPEELRAPSPQTYRAFLSEVLRPQELPGIREQIGRFARDWSVLSTQMKLNVLNSCQDLLFHELIPKPVCKLTFSRVRFAASFHPTDWSIQFSENYFQNPFHKIFKTWLHENYHALLHFLSLRYNLDSSVQVISPPLRIREVARRYPLRDTSSAASIFADKNLLGMMDRYLTYTDKSWAGWDSYYLNVEIIVENLTEYSFQQIFPNVPFRRSYSTTEDYIQLRMSGLPPIKAAPCSSRR